MHFKGTFRKEVALLGRKLFHCGNKTRNSLLNSLAPLDKCNVHFASLSHKTTCPPKNNNNNVSLLNPWIRHHIQCTSRCFCQLILDTCTSDKWRSAFVCCFFINSPIKFCQSCCWKHSDVRHLTFWHLTWCFLLSLPFFFLEWTSFSAPSGVSGADLFKKLIIVDWGKENMDMLELDKYWQVTDKHVWCHEPAIKLYSQDSQ